MQTNFRKTKRKPITVTNSERSTAACPHKWLLRYGLGIRQTSTSQALLVGNLVHRGVEAFFGGHDLKGAWTVMDHLVATHIRDLKAERGMDLFEEEKDSIASHTQSAKDIVAGYYQAWEHTRRDYLTAWNEEVFQVKLDGVVTKGAIAAHFTGKVDRLCLYQNRLWIMETKTSSVPLDAWLAKNQQSPQVVSYAIAIQALGHDVAGVIFDLVNSKPPRSAKDLATTKDGQRLMKTAGLPYCTAATFLERVLEVHPLNQLDAVDWYHETYRALLARDQSGFWFRREPIRFDASEFTRSRGELEVTLRQVSSWRKKVEALNLQRNTDEAGNLLSYKAGEVSRALDALQFDLPRQPAMCWQFNRMCTYASLCRSHNEADLVGFTVSKAGDGHDELTNPEGHDALEP